MIDNAPFSDKLDECLKNLPELYQPIYGMEGSAGSASRTCEDRLGFIFNYYGFLEKLEGRPLRVLDLGCAQGFFSLSLAARGASVLGVDYSQPNIDMCRLLASQAKGAKVDFRLESIETTINSLRPDQYDLVLGLSVFHHLVHEHGLPYVKGLLAQLADLVPHAVFEFALSSEPLYWASSQPEHPAIFLDSYTFRHLVSFHPTHLSEIRRPLYVASRSVWYFGDHGGRIEHTDFTSHAQELGFHKGSRRYFRSGNWLVKVADLHPEGVHHANSLEFSRERTFLEAPPEGANAPELLTAGQDSEQAWIVRRYIPGTLLSEVLILEPERFDANRVLKDVLRHLVVLERAGLYHADVRLWNVLLAEDGRGVLIDHGAISANIEDGDDLYGQILSFLFFAREVIERQARVSYSRRPRFVSPTHFSGAYRRWIELLWEQPPHKWSFCLLEQLLGVAEANPSPGSDLKNNVIAGVIESELSTLSNQLGWQISALDQKVESICRAVADFAGQTQSHVRQFEARFQKLDDNLLRAEASEAATAELLQQALEAVQQAQRQAQLSEDRAARSELRAAQAEARTRDTENLQVEIGLKLQQAQAQAEDAEARVHQAQTELDSARQDLRYLQQVNHQNWHLTQERGLHIQALLNSSSWKLTAPLRTIRRTVSWARCGVQVAKSAVGGSRVMFRGVGKLAVRGVAGYAQKSPRFKRMALRMLTFTPGLVMKLRQIHIESRFSQTAVSVSWGSAPAVSSRGQDAFTALDLPDFDRGGQAGVNADQRTPLEAFFCARGTRK